MKKPNLKKIHFILFLVTAVVTTFNNCSDVAFENAQEPTSLKNIDNIETTETEV
ncbi:MAG: hypothetical protein H6625_08185, partial [Bdellovibrionaceae bacterium]|nr:hypothetical protein [Pseudobdellovibrionaceae bacterium]